MREAANRNSFLGRETARCWSGLEGCEPEVQQVNGSGPRVRGQVPFRGSVWYREKSDLICSTVEKQEADGKLGRQRGRPGTLGRLRPGGHPDFWLWPRAEVWAMSGSSWTPGLLGLVLLPHCNLDMAHGVSTMQRATSGQWLSSCL